MNNESQLFRLATVLYADNNYVVSPKNILKKIIESVFIEKNNTPLTIHEIIDFIEEKYNLSFDEKEIRDIIDNDRKEESFIVNRLKKEETIFLTEKRIQHIKNKVSQKNIDFFISEFDRKHNISIEKDSLKRIIYRFLYEILETNIESFKKLINGENKVEDIISIESFSYNSEEKEIINNFLKWENEDKDKAIFAIASYALEYCMISNKSGHIQLENLKNKVFYLDANVIFRAIGINGKDRQNRTKTFLDKFVQTKTQIKISKYSDNEFKNTLSFYVSKLAIRSFSRPISSDILRDRKIRINEDIYDFYYDWRRGKSNDSLKMFENYIITLYDNFKTKYKIELDYNIPFDDRETETIKIVDEYSLDIQSYKNQEKSDFSYNSNSYNVDALNIFLIENKRNSKSSNIFDTKYFMISTDSYLRRWDYKRNNQQTPIVILPSQWLSILLRFIGRTKDDFSSFVSFLNLPNTETNIKNEQIHSVLAGISEITGDFEQQNNIYKIIVEKEFNNIIKPTNTEEYIFEQTKTLSKSILEEKINKLESHNSSIEEKNKGLEKDNSYKDEQLYQKNIKIERLEKELENKKKKELRTLISKQKNFKIEKIKKWKCKGYSLLFGCILFILFFILSLILLFYYTDSKLNYAQNIIKYIDNVESETIRTVLIGFITFFFGFGTIKTIYDIIKGNIKKYFSKKGLREKIEEIKKNKDYPIQNN